MNHYVYEITNLVNGKKYIGKRSCHCPIEDDKYMGSGYALKKAFDKYGRENFIKKIIVECNSDIEAYELEKKYIDKVKAWSNPNYYNLCGGGKGVGVGTSSPNYGKRGIKSPNYGKKASDETRAKLRIINAGKNNNMYGKTHTESAREKIRQSRVGKSLSKDTIEKIQASTKLNFPNGINAKKVICLNTGEVFDSMTLACAKYDINLSTLAKAVKTGTYLAGEVCGSRGVWQYYTDYLSKPISVEYALELEINRRRGFSEKMSIQRVGKRVDVLCKKVVLLNNKKVFDTIVDANKYMNFGKGSRISACCKGISKYAGEIDGHRAVWMYHDEYLLLSEDAITEKLKGAYPDFNKNSKEVICLNNGKIFKSLKLASEYVGQKNMSGISNCCNSITKSCGEIDGERLVWAYYDEYKNFSNEDILEKIKIAQNIRKGENNYMHKNGHSAETKAKIREALTGKNLGSNNPNSKKVILLNTLEVFGSLVDGANKYKIHRTSLGQCCRGKRKSAGKINGEPARWMYYEDYLKLQEAEI